jgi:hypothetical protein
MNTTHTAERITTEQYSQMWREFQAGMISEKEWTDFATKMWEQSMHDNIDVFKRLADR